MAIITSQIDKKEYRKLAIEDALKNISTNQNIRLNSFSLVENGKIGAPVKGATLIGSGPDAMSKITMIGDDLSLDRGVGTCGKAGQSVPVGVGQPTLKMGGITVGGTEAA